MADVATSYVENGTGPAVVLVHGFPLDHRMWMAQLEGLASKYRVIAPDMRGFGGTAGSGPVSIETLADDVHALADLLSLDKFVLGGLSMGGYVALAYAKKYPQTLRGLMLLDTRPDADAPAAKENRNKLIETARQQGAKPIADAMLGRLISEKSRANAKLVAEMSQIMESSPPEGIATLLAAMRDRPDQTEMLPSIAVPTLIVCGADDVVTPPDVMKVFHDNIPRSQLRIVPDSGHMTPMEQPEMVNQVIGEFLASLT